MPLISEKNQIAIKVETTAGTPIALALADVVLTSELPTFTPEIEFTERLAQSASLSRLGGVAGARMAKIGFKMFLRGTTLAPVAVTNIPDFDVPLQGCGIVGVVDQPGAGEIEYQPSSTTITDETSGAYCSVGIHLDGKLYSISGAIGTVTMTFTRGAPVVLDFEFTGVYTDPVLATLLVPVYGGPAAPPPFLDASPTVLGFAAKFNELVLNTGNTVVMRPDPGDVSGYHTAQITSRNATLTIDPEEEVPATQNWWTDLTGETVGVVTTGDFPSGGTTFNMFKLNCPKAQLSSVGLGDRDGVAITPLEFALQRDNDAGDNEWALEMR